MRRAFTYLAGEQWGILRVGQADGIIGIFDNGVTTNQFLEDNFNGGDNQNVPGGAPPFWFLSQAGNEYDNSKVVYISPQFAGFDFGFQWAPNTSNGYGIGQCGATLSGCPTLSSGPGANDGARILNQTAAGVRYQGKFGDLGLLAYAAYEFSGHGTYTGPAAGTAAFNTLQFPTATGGVVAGSRYTGNYDRLSFGSGGVALTFAGFTLGANAIGGRLNGQLALAPQGGVPEVAYTVGLKYVTGPLTVGVVGEIGWYQGDVRLTGVTQRRGRGITAGALYRLAPGLHGVCRIPVGGSVPGQLQLPEQRGQFECEQQFPQPGFHDRQHNQLLRPSAALAEQAAGLVPAAFSCTRRRRRYRVRALATPAGQVKGIISPA